MKKLIVIISLSIIFAPTLQAQSIVQKQTSFSEQVTHSSQDDLNSYRANTKNQFTQLPENIDDTGETKSPNKALITIKVDGQEKYKSIIQAVKDQNGLYHYPGSIERERYKVTWDWYDPRETNFSDLFVEAHHEIENKDKNNHQVEFDVVFNSSNYDLPEHQSVKANALTIFLFFATDSNGGRVSTLPEDTWGSSLLFNAVEQWGNIYAPWFMQFSGFGYITYHETWHNVNNLDSINEDISINQGFNLTSKDNLGIDLYYNLDLEQ